KTKSVKISCHHHGVFFYFFKSSSADPSHQQVRLRNNGTECLIYSWKKIDKNIFASLLPQEESCFYFNNSVGVIEPGESKALHVSFQSFNEGLYTETWVLCTEPSLLGPGSSIMFEFQGIAYWPITHQNYEWRKCQFERKIEIEINMRMATEIVDDVITMLPQSEQKFRPPGYVMSDVGIHEKQNSKETFALNHEGLYKCGDSGNLLRCPTDGSDQFTFLPSLLKMSQFEMKTHLCRTVLLKCVWKSYRMCSILNDELYLRPPQWIPHLVIPWKQLRKILQAERDTCRSMSLFWRIVSTHLPQLTSVVSLNRDKIVKSTVETRFYSPFMHKRWQNFSNLVTWHHLADAAEEIVDILASQWNKNT
uniref:CUB domain-containing protein n=1 Tax=Mesocestoides corti TaxID=53468 RepID=A0A5K3FTM4_MESCO